MEDKDKLEILKERNDAFTAWRDRLVLWTDSLKLWFVQPHDENPLNTFVMSAASAEECITLWNRAGGEGMTPHILEMWWNGPALTAPRYLPGQVELTEEEWGWWSIHGPPDGGR